MKSNMLEEPLIKLSVIFSWFFSQRFKVQESLGGYLDVIVFVNDVPAVLQAGGVLDYLLGEVGVGKESCKVAKEVTQILCSLCRSFIIYLNKGIVGLFKIPQTVTL